MHERGYAEKYRGRGEPVYLIGVWPRGILPSAGLPSMKMKG